MTVRREPLEWYVAKLRSGETFTSLLWGDGEFKVASRSVTGRSMQNDELVTPELEDETRASLLVPGDDIVRGTEPFLIEPWTYGGRDVASVRQIAAEAQSVLDEVKPPPFDWFDGTIWDTAARDGCLGPLIQILSKRDTCLVGCNDLQFAAPFTRTACASVPERNAAGQLAGIEARVHSNVTAARKFSDLPWVFVVCTGLGAIPLIMRLRKHFPGATFLDLGSTFDVFAKIGPERGWRQELYADEAKWKALINKNLQGAAG